MLIPKGAMAQVQRLTNDRCLTDTCTVTRYAIGDGYNAPDVLGTVSSTRCRILLKQTTVEIEGGVQQNFAGMVTFPGNPLTWTAPPAEDADPDAEPVTFTDPVQVNDRITIGSLVYRVDHIDEPRIDGEQLNYVAYLAYGAEVSA